MRLKHGFSLGLIIGLIVCFIFNETVQNILINKGKESSNFKKRTITYHEGFEHRQTKYPFNHHEIQNRALNIELFTKNKIVDYDSDSEFMKVMEKLQKERKLTLRKVCQNHDIVSKCIRSGNYIDKTSLYSSNYNFSVCFLPKCGSTNWLYAVMIMDDLKKLSMESSKIWDKLIKAKYERMLGLGLHSNEEILMRWNNNAKVIQVRNPFERLVSAYNNKLVPEGKGYNLFFKQKSVKINNKYKSKRRDQTERHNDTTASFEDFINHILDSSDEMDIHWTSYNLTCTPCLIDYDYIMKFETFDEDLKYFQLKQNIPHKHINASFYRSGKKATDVDKTKKYFDMISKEMAKSLYEMYKLDFEMFGYDRPSWLC